MIRPLVPMSAGLRCTGTNCIGSSILHLSSISLYSYVASDTQFAKKGAREAPVFFRAAIEHSLSVARMILCVLNSDASTRQQSVTNNSVFEYYSNNLSRILFERIVFGYFIETNTIRYSVFRYSDIRILFEYSNTFV